MSWHLPPGCSAPLARRRPFSMRRAPGASPRGFVKLWQFRRCGIAAKPARNRGPFWRDADLARVEAVLFLAREPLASRRIAELADLADGTQARTLIRRLNQLLDTQGSAVCVAEVA